MNITGGSVDAQDSLSRLDIGLIAMGALMTLLLIIKLSGTVMRHRQEYRTNRSLAAQQVVGLEMKTLRSERSEVVHKELVPFSSKDTATTGPIVNSLVNKELVPYSGKIHNSWETICVSTAHYNPAKALWDQPPHSLEVMHRAGCLVETPQ